jgi:HEAT repeat protein
MGLFDFLGGGSPAERAQKLKAKLTQKYGDPTTRQKAIEQLGELQSAAAVPVLMQRFTFMVEPQTTDADEKATVFDLICELKAEAVPPVVEFLTRSDSASSWAVKILEAVLPESEVIGVVTAELERLGAAYTRDPEKKEVLLHFLSEKHDDRIGPAARPFLHDMSDDVKMAAIKTVSSARHEPAREELLSLLVAEETAKRVQTACVGALAEAGFGVQGFREKVEARLPGGHFIDKAGLVKKRGS